MRVILDDENCFFFKFCLLLAQGINIEYKNLKHNQNELDDFPSIFSHTWNVTKERVIRIRNVTCFVASPMLSDCT